jgi:hypothetical protein
LELFGTFQSQAETIARPGTIVVVECRTTTTHERIDLPQWHAEECTFPPLSAREWYQWVSGSF